MSVYYTIESLEQISVVPLPHRICMERMPHEQTPYMNYIFSGIYLKQKAIKEIQIHKFSI